MSGLDDPRPAATTDDSAGHDDPVADLSSLHLRLRAESARSVGRYVLAAELAPESEADVRLVWDQDLRRRLAIRTSGARTGVSAEEADVASFVREVRLTSRLEHPGIVPIHDLALDGDGHLRCVMRQVLGWRLSEVLDWIHGRCVPEDVETAREWNLLRVIGALQAVCETVAYAHSEGVVHGGLCPDHIMIGRFGEVHVTHWASASATTTAGGEEPASEDAPSARFASDASSAAAAGPSSGHADRYAAPERVLGSGSRVDVRADVYSIGAILLHSLQGAPPCDEGSQPTVSRGIRSRAGRASGEPLSMGRQRVPPELSMIAARAGARDPAARYPDVESLAADLRAFLEGRAVSALPTGPLTELLRWSRRNPASVAMLAMVAALVVFALSFDSSRRLMAAERVRQRALVNDAFVGESLLRSRDELWPPTRERTGAMRDWLARVEDFVQRRDLHRNRPTAASTRVLELVDELQAPGGPVEHVRGRLELAEHIREESVTSQRARRLWREAARRVAAAPPYDGLSLIEQEGLVPLGPDPVSGLEEFAYRLSGDVPRRDDRGALLLDAESAIVLVLLPGGSATIGAQADFEHAPNFDPLALPNEGPVVELSFEPFFLSKCELTQAQWARMEGGTPATYFAGRGGPEDQVAPEYGEFSWTHPVETVAWERAAALCARWGLALPSEGQWEYAAWCGRGFRSLRELQSGALALHANLDDTRFVAGVSGQPRDERADGFVVTARVGSLEPNAWGLHDMIGNVEEWCLPLRRDQLGEQARRWNDVVRGVHPAVMRGGSFFSDEVLARPTARRNVEARFQQSTVGLRPARRLLARSAIKARK